MCEYCGCQDVEAIAELTREHDAVVNLIGDVRTAHARGDVPAIAATAQRIAAVLGPHTEVEEHGLFPLLTGDFPDQVAALADEHRRMENVLAGSPGDPSWPQELLAALEMLREHILKEQDGVFPAALTTLTGDDWDAVDAARRRAGSAI
jgi:hemerythrin-like domain-containing protein